MKPIRTAETNTIFVLEGCGDLPATKCHDANGVPHVQSCWQLTEKELALIAKTGCIHVVTVGKTVPPMSLAIESMLDK